MLKKDKTERMTVDKAMERFNMLFEEYARAREDLEGAESHSAAGVAAFRYRHKYTH